VAVPPTPPIRTNRRRATRGAVVLAAVVGMILGSAIPAAAKPSASELKAQIAAQNKALEPVIEQYNGLRVKLAADKAKAKQLESQMGRQQLQAAVAQGRMGEIAASIYKTGPIGATQALFASDSTKDLLDVLGSLNEIAYQQASQISDATKLVSTYQDQQTELAALISNENKQYETLTKQKSQIQAKVDSLQALLDEANGGGGGGGGNLGGGPYKKSQLMPKPCPVTSSSGKGHTAAVKACSLVWDTSRNPPWRMYGWGDAGPNKFDCSGLTMTAWAAAGKSLTHYTGGQWNQSYAIAQSELRPGDLVFYYKSHSHVALYVGGGWIVQAEQTGEPIKMSPMTFDSPRYYRRVNGT
jgi:cell wall-associated NlpC family hydrolase